jgi:hypothetical protein
MQISQNKLSITPEIIDGVEGVDYCPHPHFLIAELNTRRLIDLLVGGGGTPPRRGSTPAPHPNKLGFSYKFTEAESEIGRERGIEPNMLIAGSNTQWESVRMPVKMN